MEERLRPGGEKGIDSRWTRRYIFFEFDPTPSHIHPGSKEEHVMSAANPLLDQEFTPEVCYDLLPEWKGLDVRISQLSGGITNKLYRVRSEKGDCTVRIYGDKTDLFINREAEAHTITEMSKLGVCAPLVKYMPDKGVTIVEYIDDAIVLKNEHFLDASLYAKIVAPIRKIHASGIRLKQVFNPLLEVMRMSAILARLDVTYDEFDIAGTIQRLIKLSSIINLPESQYTPCHNDLLADNFILIRDSARHRYASPMYIIDWEYAGMAPRYYDIADMFQEVLVPREAETAIVAEYCAGVDFDRTLLFVDLFKPFPDIYWFLWSLIQLNVSKIAFDYYTYGKDKYDNAMKNFALRPGNLWRRRVAVTPVIPDERESRPGPAFLRRLAVGAPEGQAQGLMTGRHKACPYRVPEPHTPL